MGVENGNDHRPFSVVHSIIYDEQKKSPVSAWLMNTKEEVIYHAKVIFVNAATMNSNLPEFVSNRLPNGREMTMDYLENMSVP